MEAYSAKITQANRALIVLMIDQSGSMAEPYASNDSPQGHITKAQAVADFCNSMIGELILKCKYGSVYRDYFDVAVIGYSGAGVYPVINSEREILSSSELAACVVRCETVRERRVKLSGVMATSYYQQKIWVEPQAEGRTPTLMAFEKLTSILQSWRRHQVSLEGFPPTIINITDGEPTDCRAEQLLIARQEIDKLGTLNGEPLLINAHISSDNKTSIIFPCEGDSIAPRAQLWYDMSSIMPSSYGADIAAIKDEKFVGTSKLYRGVIYNAGFDTLVKLLNIGSSTTSHIL